jgi:uncharacterized membrane protein
MSAVLVTARVLAAMVAMVMIAMSLVFAVFGETESAVRCLVLTIIFGCLALLDLKIEVRDTRGGSRR